MAATKSQTVQSKGIFHGLPTYPTDSTENADLTAIVTGATGISGYHMLKVLAAAPERWSKIYTLSRRPPSDYFFADLGDGAARVEHVEADFQAGPEALAEMLKAKIGKVDHVFFFSYMQPAQKGDILGMWSNAEELTRVNTDLLVNFLGALKLSGLKPKRFLLQTGAKNYGFHIGPATSPSFESDPRVTLESNFYYPQEDHLAEYCRENGAQWNVVRPSYIIGAVRDNLLNHMVGLGVYASIQAHLKEPVAFPGDYTAWDREYCQSTALLNAYLEEWAVLNPEAGNEAFNAQDGLPFTWGRFWAYLGDWYGTTWTPPETDPSKYRAFESRWEETPRGYGPRGVTYSTFSLLEWSERVDVQEAWKELVQRHGLLLDPFTDAGRRAQIFGMSDSAIIGGWALSLSMRKARKMGFHGTVDSYESAFHTLHDLARLKVLPPPAAARYTD
ncbi:uncharacterized protein A1O5_09991 [Cladophialophora psammophila CBS 110553]|uniref:PRISE-like Rossmann-fold domain-containing protein n=1 Tax=Cladophialophora psammophila CBS 110553 TaxID=1182543 RepID=W9WQ54_9EURO|nr:uncharacterized protein A1O5_09991 [Cladophialophora psammophila CBS 110553]EXJ66796.1 hypothetical protein A1O5_09991 [Cladophialophora psammophila CBS 110553]